jgi:glycogen synthase
MSKPLRVLMTADAVGGVWTYAMALCRELGRSDVEVCLATMGAMPDQAQAAEASSLWNVTLRPSNYRLEWMQEPWADVEAAGDWLLDLAAAWRPDIVHLNGYAHAALAWPAPILIVAHSCVRSWWQAVKGEDAPAGWEPYTHAVRNGIAAADMVVAPSRAMLDALRLYEVRPRGDAVVPNGLPDTERPIGEKRPFVLSAGRLWDEAKNIAMLDRAAGRISWPVCVAGDDHHPVNGPIAFRHVQPLGRLTQAGLRDRMAAASIFVLPVRYEPFGLAALEAAQRGCALVLGDIPSQREVWGDAALFVPPDDEDALATAINRLISDRSALRIAAERAWKKGRDYTADRMAAAYLSIYQRLASQRERAQRRVA